MPKEKARSKSIPMPPDWLRRMKAAPPHPGIIFREFYRQAGTRDEVSQAECARRMGISINRLNEIERGKRGVSPETAVLLEALTGASAEMWCNLQMHHALWNALKSMRARAQKVKPLRRIEINGQ